LHLENPSTWEKSIIETLNEGEEKKCKSGSTNFSKCESFIDKIVKSCKLLIKKFKRFFFVCLWRKMLRYLTHKLKTQSINEENSNEKVSWGNFPEIYIAKLNNGNFYNSLRRKPSSRIKSLSGAIKNCHSRKYFSSVPPP
jgi:hypothetical protein